MSSKITNEILGKRSVDGSLVSQNDNEGQKIGMSMSGDGPLFEDALMDQDDVDSEELEGLDERGVKKAILNLEKAILKNREMRVKFSEEPLKFMESEIQLNVAIQEMHSIATVPHHYNLLCKLKAVESLTQLLLHENTDISCSVINLIQELTDVDTVNESIEGAHKLIDGLIENQLMQIMMNNLERLNENVKDEADGVHNTFSVVENILELRPKAADLAARCGLVAWILSRLNSKRPFDGNRLFCSEMLAVLLQTSAAAREVLFEKSGMDILLRQVAMYKRSDPASADEVEYMENMFDCICAALMNPKNKENFVKTEGFHLINIMLKMFNQAAEGALKVLDYALTGVESKQYCIDYVQLFGVRTLFEVFMRAPCKAARKNHTIEEHEEHICSILANLFKNCDSGQRSKLCKRFEENKEEKLERLTELHFKFSAMVDRFANANRAASKNMTEEEMEELYLDKLANGLCTLQQVDYMLAELLSDGPTNLRERALKIFSMRRSNFDAVKATLLEYASNLEESPDSGNEIAFGKRYIENLVSRMDVPNR